ncbi:MAG: autotransporter strand-loop-strand O-heptosyltransferase [Victivallaceae bacterium]
MGNDKDISVKPAAAGDFSIGVAAGKPSSEIVISGPPAAPSASAPKEAAPQQPPQESIYGAVPSVPTQKAVEGITFDFNDGIRILFPHNGKTYRVCFSDIDSGIILYNADTVEGAYVTSVKKFFIRFKLQIFRPREETPIFEHVYDPRGKEVMIQLPVSTIGDSIGWFSYVERFQKKHKCKVICVMMPHISMLVRDQYPDITFVSKEDTVKYKPYACYYMGLFFKGNVDNQPIDFRYIGLHRTAGYILGVDPSDDPPRFNLSAPRRIKEPYVCIAAQSSSQAKYWNNPHGWLDVVQFLKDKGYRVLCVDRDAVYGHGINQNFIPYGTENFTGLRPLQERVDLIKDADFFIGLSSGLSWLAWGCRVPVVMISGFTHPTNEFATPFRVINYHTCHSCWNDMRVDFDHYDFLWCPRLKNTPRQFECTRLISSEQVIKTIKSIPEYLERHPEDVLPEE